MRQSENLCPRYQYAVEIIARRWTALIVKVLIDGPKRFNEISAALEVVSDRMLSERLKDLEREGVVERHVHPESPIRVEYKLTTKGIALEPILQAIEYWSKAWITVEEATGQTDDHHERQIPLTVEVLDS